ncbi:MAG: acyl carrier protein [Rhodoferax sp.]
MLEDTIKNYLINSAGVDPAKFDTPGLQVADLALDSLGLLEMLFEIEDKYGLQVPEPMRFLAMSFTEMVADIESTVRAHHDGQLPVLDAEKAAC